MIGDLLRRNAEVDPERVAGSLGEASLTHRELDRTGNGMALQLRKLGVGLGGFVSARDFRELGWKIEDNGKALPLPVPQPPELLPLPVHQLGAPLPVRSGRRCHVCGSRVKISA